MKNVFRVLKRDILRLIKTPAALVVIAALLVLPSIYSWYNVVGFWDPYENTGNLRVSVVNQDEGASSELTGEMHVGDMIVDQLKENDQLDWTFSDYDTAMDDLKSGESYAVYVIPKDFTEDLLSLTTGNFIKPDIEYYVNEKLSPVSPKITDTGATTLDETINSTFVSTVSDVAVDAIDKVLGQSEESMGLAKSQANAKATEAISSLTGARDLLSGVASLADDAKNQTLAASDSLSGVKSALDDGVATLDNVAGIASSLQGDLLTFSAGAMPAVNAGLSGISDASSQANIAVGKLASNIASAQGNVDASLSQAQSIVDQSAKLASMLRKTAELLPDSNPSKASLLAAAAALEKTNESVQGQIDSIGQLSSDLQSTSSSLGTASESLNGAIQGTVDAMGDYTEGLFGTTVPQIAESLGGLHDTAISLKASLKSQQGLIDQTSSLLGELGGVLDTAHTAVSETESLLGGLQDELTGIQSDVSAIGASMALSPLVDDGTLDASKIAEFMGSPTEVVTEQLYHLNAYGSAMAPLFMNLTFWIGAFMLLVIMRQECDSEGIPNLTLKQRYLGRFLLFAILAVLQAVICCAGIAFLGVETANLPALFFAAAIASLSYLSIIYMLSVVLQHVGKGICIVLVFAQIPGATGLYPIELTPPFFQFIYPMLPFTYGIGAMREAICGFYGNHYLSDIGMLLFFAAAAMIIGLVARPLMANTNRMAAAQVAESDLLTGEDAEVPERQYRFSQIIKVLADRDDSRQQLLARRERFMRWYPRFIRGSIVIGILAPVVLAVVFALTAAEKVVVLTIWLCSLILLLIFLMVIESLRYGFDRQLELSDMSSEGLIDLYSKRNRMTHVAPSVHGAPAPRTVSSKASDTVHPATPDGHAGKGGDGVE